MQNLKNKFILIFLAPIIFALFSTLINQTLVKSKKELLIYAGTNVVSADPYDFNSLPDRLLSGTVQIGLFTSYKDGKLSPALVSEWKSTDANRKWIFKIRQDVKFSDGNFINPIDVKNSLKRIIFLSNKRKSDQPLVKNIKGFEKIHNFSDEIEGLKIEDGSVVISLNKSDPLFHEKLSFGMYSVVSSKNYDSVNANWIPSVNVTSGPYTIESFNNDFLVLKLRNDYPEALFAANAFNAIKIFWDKNEKNKADLAVAYSAEDTANKNYNFYGNTNSYVLFFRVYSWINKNSILSTVENRICLRNKFLRKLNSLSFKTVNSFYPLILPGVDEVHLADATKCKPFSGQKIVVRLLRNTQVKKFAIINEALMATLEESGLKIETTEFKDSSEEQKLSEINDDKQIPRIDIAALSTDIGNEDPRYTTMVMLSKDGINLPDPGMRMKKTVKDPGFSINRINSLIYEYGIIWPVFHYSFGYFIDKNKIDLSRFNHQLPLSELHWIGVK